MKARMIAKLLVAVSALGVGGVFAFALFPRLQQDGYPSSHMELARYTLFAADVVASLFAGVLVGYLFYFCLWECLAKGTMHFLKKRR